MNEKRRCVEIWLLVDRQPFVALAERPVMGRLDRMARGGKRQDVENDGLAIPFPPVFQETAARPPTHRQRVALVQRPLPVGAGVKVVRQPAQFGFPGLRPVEIGGSRQHAGDQQCRIDGRQLAPPRPPACLHVEEVIIEPLVAGRIRLAALLAAGKKAQRRQHPGHSLAA